MLDFESRLVLVLFNAECPLGLLDLFVERINDKLIQRGLEPNILDFLIVLPSLLLALFDVAPDPLLPLGELSGESLDFLEYPIFPHVDGPFELLNLLLLLLGGALHHLEPLATPRHLLLNGYEFVIGEAAADDAQNFVADEVGT